MAETPFMTGKDYARQGRLDWGTALMTRDVVRDVLLETQTLEREGRVPAGHMKGVLREGLHFAIMNYDLNPGTKPYVERYLDTRIDGLSEKQLSEFVHAARPGQEHTMTIFGVGQQALAADMGHVMAAYPDVRIEEPRPYTEAQIERLASTNSAFDADRETAIARILSHTNNVTLGRSRDAMADLRGAALAANRAPGANPSTPHPGDFPLTSLGEKVRMAQSMERSVQFMRMGVPGYNFDSIPLLLGDEIHPAKHPVKSQSANPPLDLAYDAVDELKRNGGLQLAQVRPADERLAFAPGSGVQRGGIV